MKILETIRDSVVGGIAGVRLGARELWANIHENEQHTVDKLVKEATGLAQLEVALDDQGWTEMVNQGQWNFSRSNLQRLIGLSRVVYLINPLIKRAVTVQELYVWGSGCTIEAESDIVKEVLEDFYNDPKNQSVVGAAWPEREREQRIDGNTFLVFFYNKWTGSARVRILPVDQVFDIYTNPEDFREPWYYRRMNSTAILLGEEGEEGNIRDVYYPALRYNPRTKPSSLNGIPIDWTKRVRHIKTGGLSMMKFGIPELYSSIAWAVAYKKILENFATVLAAYARIAMKVSGLGGKNPPAAAKSKLGTTKAVGMSDTNPPPNTGSWLALQGGVDINAVKTANSTTGPDEARALRSMVAAGSDTPEHFFGDSDIGNFATSTTLDRPTELKMIARQGMWADVMADINGCLIEWSARAPKGKLREAGYGVNRTYDAFDGSEDVNITPPDGKSIKSSIVFPDILQRAVTDKVRAVVMAATLGGRPAEGIIPDRAFLFKLLLTALGEKNATALMEKYYPSPVLQGFKDPKKVLDNETLDAQGKKDLGDAALKQADAAIKKAEQPPAPVAKPKGGTQ